MSAIRGILDEIQSLRRNQKKTTLVQSRSVDRSFFLENSLLSSRFSGKTFVPPFLSILTSGLIAAFWNLTIQI